MACRLARVSRGQGWLGKLGFSSIGVGVFNFIYRGGGLMSVDQVVRPLVGTSVSGISRNCRKLPSGLLVRER